MAILSTELLDTIAESAEIDSTNVGTDWTVTNSKPIAMAAAAAHGVRGGRIANATAPHRITYTEPATTDQRVYSFYFNLRQAPTANSYVCSIQGGDWRITSDRTVAVRNGTSVSGGTSTEALALDTWYRAELLTNTSGQELRIFEGESLTPYITLIAALTDTTKIGFAAGSTSSPNNISIDVDTFRVGDTWVGPYGAPALPLDTPANFQFNAHAGPDNVSIAASWSAVQSAVAYNLEVERRDGSAWVPLDTWRVTTTSRNLTTTDGLVAGTTYRGRVQALPVGY